MDFHHFLIKKVLKKPIFDEKGGQNWKFQKIQKSTSRQLKYPGCVQILGQLKKNCGRELIGMDFHHSRP